MSIVGARFQCTFYVPPQRIEAVAVTAEEGGKWHPFKPFRDTHEPNRIRTVHAIKFADGSIWDAVNGFRPTHAEEQGGT
jgi:hypothetical protein